MKSPAKTILLMVILLFYFLLDDSYGAGMSLFYNFVHPIEVNRGETKDIVLGSLQNTDSNDVVVRFWIAEDIWGLVSLPNDVNYVDYIVPPLPATTPVNIVVTAPSDAIPNTYWFYAKGTERKDTNDCNGTICWTVSFTVALPIEVIAPRVSIDTTSLQEGNVGQTQCQFTLNLDPPSTDMVTVEYVTQDGSATLADSDYEFSSGIATFEPNEITKVINIPVNGDTGLEASEFFFVNLANTTNCWIRDGQAFGIIENDDGIAIPLVHNITQDNYYDTIQAAIDDANGYDEIVLSPGVYRGGGNLNISFLGKAITVRSEDPNNPSVVAITVIDCQGGDFGFDLRNNEDANSIIDGLTITDAHNRGIYCFECAPTIRNCVIKDTAIRDGIYGCDGPIINCTVAGTRRGAGMRYCDGTITNCKITGCSAYGILSLGGASVTDCVVSGNSFHGIYTTGTINNCIITGNLYTGIARAASISNCIITGNRGGLNWNGSSSIDNCTITGNRFYGIKSTSNQDYDNCIIWDNDGNSILSGSPTISYSNIEGNWPGEGNIDEAPNFVDLGHWDEGDPNNIFDDVWLDGDYHLQPGSPCIDAGDSNSVPADTVDLDGDGNTAEPLPWDLDGRNRFADGDCNDSNVVDMGAYEFAWVYIGDFDGQCDVDFGDFAIFALAWLTEEGEPGYNPACDIGIPSDKYIDWRDLAVLGGNWPARL